MTHGFRNLINPQSRNEKRLYEAQPFRNGTKINKKYPYIDPETIMPRSFSRRFTRLLEDRTSSSFPFIESFVTSFPRSKKNTRPERAG